MADRLKERVALVTVAATGIGRATIERLTSEGAIVIAGIADDSQRHDMASFEAVMLDVRSEADWGRAVAHVEQQHGGLDILVNNAGIHRLATALETTQMVWTKSCPSIFGVASSAARQVIPAMQRRGGGAIVNLCSINAITGVAGSIAYSKSKGGVLTMTMALAIEHVSDRIRVNCVCPGLRIPMKAAGDSDRNQPPVPTEASR